MTPRDRDVRDELEAHIAARVEDNLARGLPAEDAEREARARFGSVDTIERKTLQARRRGQRTAGLRQDIRHAALGLVRRPVTALSGVLVVAAGLAAALASAKIAVAIVAAPPGIERPGELVSVLESTNGRHGSRVTYAAFAAMDKVAQVVAWDGRELQMIAGPVAERRLGAVVSGGYFEILGARAAAGRPLTRADDEQHAGVAVVSWRLAERIAGSAPSALGLTPILNGRPFTIVGVAERDFHGLDAGSPVDLWLPMSSEPDISAPTIFPDGHRVQGFVNTPGIGFLVTAARISRPEARAAVEAQLTSALRSARDRRPDSRAGEPVAWLTDRPWITPFKDSRAVVLTAARSIGWAVALILILSSSCLGGLFVGRFVDRAREFGIRLALGATRGRLMQLAAIDVTLIVAAGSLVAWAGSAILVNAAASLHMTGSIVVGDALAASTEARSLAMLAGMAVGMTAFALASSLMIVQRAPMAAAAASGRVTQSGSRLRRLLLAAQVAAGCALISAALLLTTSIASLESRPLGYDAAEVAYAETNPTGAGLDADAMRALTERLWADPSLSTPTSAFADIVPYGGDSGIFAKGAGSPTPVYPFSVSRVNATYFDVLGIRLLSGRRFSAADATRQVAIVSEPLAKLYWPNSPAVGQTLLVGGERGVPHEIIGVVDGLRDSGLKAAPAPRFYLPYSAEAEALTLVARARADESIGRVVERTAEATRAVDARLVVIRQGPLIGLARRAVEQRRLLRFVTAIVGAASLFMVAIGVWGLSHASLRRRWREFGIRQALGAGRRDITTRAFADALFVGFAGGILGIAGGWQLGVVLQSMLYGVSPADPAVLGASAATVIVAAAAGAIPPARQAARLDAADLLRHD